MTGAHAWPDPLLLAERDLALATDLYQLTMAAAYDARADGSRAVFELFVRRLPEARSFLVLAGLEQALAAVRDLRFSTDQIDFLRGLPTFGGVAPGFFDTLAGFRFRGDVWAMPEGTLFFPAEPVLRVEGSLLEAQIIETLLLSIINFQSAIASKAARVRLAAGREARLADFGSRRAHGPQAALWAARAAYLAGFDATSNVLAGLRVGVPVVGTMAHSFVMSFDREEDAFAHFQQVFPGHTVHLVDTYDSREGIRKAIAHGGRFQGIRLDSGDVDRLAREAREMLDAAGREDAEILVSGDLDEWKIGALVGGGAPIDAYGVGSRLATSADAPYVPGVYKLVETRDAAGRRHPRFKASAGKATSPGAKQVLRRRRDGCDAGDRVTAIGVPPKPDEVPLLAPVMVAGEVVTVDSLEGARARCRAELAALPPELQGPEPAAAPYPVTVDLERGAD